jgi:hypothetical protein
MGELDAGILLKQDHRQVAEAAAADRAVVDAARGLAGGVKHVLEGLEGSVGMGGEQVRRGPDQHDRVEVFAAIEGQVGNESRVHGLRVEDEEPGVAVGRSVRRRRGSDAARGAPAVVHDDVRPEPLLQVRLGQADDGFDRPAGGKRNDDCDGAGRPVLRSGRDRGERQDEQTCCRRE